MKWETFTYESNLCTDPSFSEEAAHEAETDKNFRTDYTDKYGRSVLFMRPGCQPFLEPKTCRKMKFVYSNNPNSQKIMEEVFDMDKLECRCGGRNPTTFNFKEYGERMKEDDFLDSNGSVNIDSDEGSSRNGSSFKSHFEEDGSQQNDEKLLENDIDLPENGDNLPGNNSQENGVAHVVNVKSHLTIASNEQLPWFYAAISHLGV
ncbi:hypothetical protein AMTRI_Chr04g251610 [Amborella trichopoda]